MCTLICILFGFILAAGAAPPAHPLAGTGWRLFEFQSMDDSVVVITPAAPSRFTMRLNEDGTVAMMLDCNRASGSWRAGPIADV